MSISGKIIYENGDIYSGDFLDGLMHGHGKMSYFNGAVYFGEFEYDLLHGNGEYTYPDKSVYQGKFKEGLQHGLGCLSDENGATLMFGYWLDGEFYGTKKPLYSDEKLNENNSL